MYKLSSVEFFEWKSSARPVHWDWPLGSLVVLCNKSKDRLKVFAFVFEAQLFPQDL